MSVCLCSMILMLALTGLCCEKIIFGGLHGSLFVLHLASFDLHVTLSTSQGTKMPPFWPPWLVIFDENRWKKQHFLKKTHFPSGRHFGINLALHCPLQDPSSVQVVKIWTL